MVFDGMDHIDQKQAIAEKRATDIYRNREQFARKDLLKNTKPEPNAHGYAGAGVERKTRRSFSSQVEDKPDLADEIPEPQVTQPVHNWGNCPQKPHAARPVNSGPLGVDPEHAAKVVANLEREPSHDVIEE